MKIEIVTFEQRESILFMPLDKMCYSNRGVLKLPGAMP